MLKKEWEANMARINELKAQSADVSIQHSVQDSVERRNLWILSSSESKSWIKLHFSNSAFNLPH